MLPNRLAPKLAALLAVVAVAVPAAAQAAPEHGVGKSARADYRATKSQANARIGLATLGPRNGQTVAGTVAWTVEPSGFSATKINFAVDGGSRSTDTRRPWSYSLATTGLSNGPHTLTATAYAGGRAIASSQVTVVVANTKRGTGTVSTPVVAPTPEPTPVTSSTPTSAPEPAPETGPEGPHHKIYWGAWIGDQLTGEAAPWDMSAVSKFEEETGKPLSLVNFAAPFANCSGSSCSYYNFPVNEFNNIRSHGSIPVYSWSSQSIPIPGNLSEPNFQLSDVIEGRYDSYIRRFAEAAKAWGHPFFLRFNWEMNGGWFVWAEGVNGNQPGEYVAAWRHVHDIFTAVGATNATWVWCPNVDPENRFQNLASLYPGDEYVDWTGLDGYNWGTNPARPDRWQTFDQLYRSTYRTITESIAPGKPMLVSEVGSTEYGGSKATWIREMLETIPRSYPQIRGLLWFDNYADGMDWPLQTSTTAAEAFKAGIQSSDYLGNQFGNLPFGSVAPVT
jgi:mannan endo-1,4-beta-mannosidase